MNEVSLFRLYVLRALYLFVVIGLGMLVVPQIFTHTKPWEFFHGVTTCMLVAFWLLCILGLRYPLQLLPILMWELIWKTVWLILIPLPLWLSGTLDDSLIPNVINVSCVVLVYIAMPWSYVYNHYVKNQSNPWRNVK
ncbi:hypothetical protein S2091_4152 [Solimicrobium silvestre]|uniref:Uncharacterized protein n=1 Tax=Solimicrobium silvestre TaxID=2099400 RepID=A0A2S9GTX1_9BURK|nr:hypothetical protein S2091_4152 [Solimicrobium silvestre]